MNLKLYCFTPLKNLATLPSTISSLHKAVGGGGSVGAPGERDVTTAWRILHTAGKLQSGDVAAVDR